MKINENQLNEQQCKSMNTNENQRKSLKTMKIRTTSTEQTMKKRYLKNRTNYDFHICTEGYVKC